MAKGDVSRVIKIWGGNGRRTARRDATGYGTGKAHVYDNTGFDFTPKKAMPSAKDERVIDFETLLSWYNEQNSAAAAGNEFTSAFMYASKQKNLKFL